MLVCRAPEKCLNEESQLKNVNCKLGCADLVNVFAQVHLKNMSGNAHHGIYNFVRMTCNRIIWRFSEESF